SNAYAAFGGGLTVGGAAGYGLGYGLATLTTACFPCGTVASAGLFSVAAYQLASNNFAGASNIYNSFQAVGNGTATPGQAFTAGSTLGGVIGGYAGGYAAATGSQTGITQGAYSLYDTSITSAGSKNLNVSSNVTAANFQYNLISNGYIIVSDGVNRNGQFSVLSNDASTYTIYTRTSTGSSGAQYIGFNGNIIKYSLGSQ
ncbi:MAG: hypothetical protein PHW13_02860, partial [Methylococcales bacterium]|nr:hypothetical protein [Methylococcales bacterium]